MKPINDLKFELYRYQINPVKTKQLELFGEVISFEDLKKRKNQIFADIILEKELQTIFGKGVYLQKKYFKEGNVYLYKFASKKHITHHTKELEDEVIEDYPFVYLIINNNPSKQIIAVSNNYKAFNSTETVANIIENRYSNILLNQDLTFSLTPILDEKEYWSVLEKYKDRITHIRFEIIKPNITNLSKALKKGVKQLVSSTNSIKTKIELNAPDNQTLERIDKENPQILTLSKYSVQGGGQVSLKAKGVKGRIKTSKTIRTYEIKDIHIEGSVEDVSKAIKNITGQT